MYYIEMIWSRKQHETNLAAVTPQQDADRGGAEVGSVVLGGAGIGSLVAGGEGSGGRGWPRASALGVLVQLLRWAGLAGCLIDSRLVRIMDVLSLD